MVSGKNLLEEIYCTNLTCAGCPAAISQSAQGAIQTDVKCGHVGWVKRFFAKPNKPKLQEQVLLFRFVGFRDKAAQPNLHICSTPHQFESHPSAHFKQRLPQ